MKKNLAINETMKMHFKRLISQLLIFTLMITGVQLGNINGVNAATENGFTVRAGNEPLVVSGSGKNLIVDNIEITDKILYIEPEEGYNIDVTRNSVEPYDYQGVKVSSQNGNTIFQVSILYCNNFDLTITATDKNTGVSKTYNVNFKFKESQAEKFSFSSISLSDGTMLGYVNGREDYSTSVSDDVDKVTVKLLDDKGQAIPGTVIKLDGKTGSTFTLSGGENYFTIQRRITISGNSTVSKIFTLSLNKKGIAKLKSLSGVTLSPSFDPEVNDYTANVPTTQSTITLTPTAVDNSSVIRIDGSVVKSGTRSEPIKLDEGKNDITIQVKTLDGEIGIYKLEVTRAEAPRSSYLKALRINSASLSPGFNKAILEYTASVDNKVTAVTVTPTAEYATSTIKVNGKSVASGANSKYISLDPGANEIEIQVTDEKGDKTTYKVVVTRRYGKDNVKLGSLKTTEGTLSPKFDPETYLYTVKVDRAISKIKIIFTAQNDKATIKIDGKEYASAQESDYIDLKIGANIVNIEVVAEDKKTTTTYKMSVIRDKIQGINEWVVLGGDWTFYDAIGMQVKNKWVKYDNKWFFLNVSGYMEKDGWLRESGNWYYLNTDGTMKSGWFKDNGYWYYLQGNGAMKHSGWGQYDSKFYLFNTNGMLQTGWYQEYGKWYFLADDGVMQKGWIYYNKNWYYFNDDGTMRTGWIYTNNQYSYLNNSGVMQIGWQKINGKWYYFDHSGKMKIGNIFLDGRWYYLSSDGSLQ